MIARLMGLRTVSPVALQQLTEQGEPVVLIDVNRPERWQQGHVPGARYQEPGGDMTGTLPAEKDATLVFYCSGPLCSKAPKAARRAEQMGYTDVRVMSAGITGWEAAHLPTESGAKADVK